MGPVVDERRHSTPASLFPSSLGELQLPLTFPEVGIGVRVSYSMYRADADSNRGFPVRTPTAARETRARRGKVSHARRASSAHLWGCFAPSKGSESKHEPHWEKTHPGHTRPYAKTRQYTAYFVTAHKRAKLVLSPGFDADGMVAEDRWRSHHGPICLRTSLQPFMPTTFVVPMVAAVGDWGWASVLERCASCTWSGTRSSLARHWVEISERTIRRLGANLGSARAAIVSIDWKIP